MSVTLVRASSMSRHSEAHALAFGDRRRGICSSSTRLTSLAPHPPKTASRTRYIVSSPPFARPSEPVVENSQTFCGSRLVFLAPRPHRLDPLDQVLRHQLLALDAADLPRCGSRLIRRCAIVFRAAGKQLVPVEHRANVGVARDRCGACALRVGHHLADLRANLVGVSLSEMKLP